jgi:hypothetical protein
LLAEVRSKSDALALALLERDEAREALRTSASRTATPVITFTPTPPTMSGIAPAQMTVQRPPQ